MADVSPGVDGALTLTSLVRAVLIQHFQSKLHFLLDFFLTGKRRFIRSNQSLMLTSCRASPTSLP